MVKIGGKCSTWFMNVPRNYAMEYEASVLKSSSTFFEVFFEFEYFFQDKFKPPNFNRMNIIQCTISLNLSPNFLAVVDQGSNTYIFR